MLGTQSVVSFPLTTPARPAAMKRGAFSAGIAMSVASVTERRGRVSLFRRAQDWWSHKRVRYCGGWTDKPNSPALPRQARQTRFSHIGRHGNEKTIRHGSPGSVRTQRRALLPSDLRYAHTFGFRFARASLPLQTASASRNRSIFGRRRFSACHKS